MKLEFLPDGSNDGALLRIYDFEVAEIEQLFAAVLALASGDQEHYEVHNLPGVDAISGCKFFLCVGTGTAAPEFFQNRRRSNVSLHRTDGSKLPAWLNHFCNRESTATSGSTGPATFAGCFPGTAIGKSG